MTATQQERQVGAWQGSAVDVPTIEAALTHLWQAGSQQATQDARQPPARSSVLNLVVYATGDDEATRAAEAIARLSERHPSRTICVVADPAAPSASLDASVAGYCAEQAATHDRLCWEHIKLTAHGSTVAHVPGVVIPLLRPDLPTLLWWAADIPFGTPLLGRMLDLCDRLVVDSALLADPLAGLAKLAALTTTLGNGRSVSDFNWLRLLSWRHLTAQFFDAPELQPYVQRIDSVAMRVSGAGQTAFNPMQPLLLAGWLASCLGWSARPQDARLRGNGLRLGTGRTGAITSLEITAQPGAGLPPGEMQTLALAASLRDVPGHFSIERQATSDEATTTTTIDGAAGVAHTVRMAMPDLADLLAMELEIGRQDSLYQAALQAAAALCERVVTEES